MPNDDKVLVKKYGSEDSGLDGFEERNVRERDMDRRYNKEVVRLLRPRCSIGVWGYRVSQERWNQIFGKKG